MLFVNFKTYEQGTGTKALELVRLLEGVSQESGIKVIPVLQAADVKEAVQTSKLEIWNQHVDATPFGAHTGSTLPEAVQEDGASGTFLNHSEHKFENFEDLGKAHQRAQEVGLKTLIFAADLQELEKILTLKPNFASYEPPELVGSKEASVSSEKPEIISQAVELCKKVSTPLIVGAGIKSLEDVKKSVELGATGIAVASSIVTADNPKEEVLKLIEGFK